MDTACIKRRTLGTDAGAKLDTQSTPVRCGRAADPNCLDPVRNGHLRDDLNSFLLQRSLECWQQTRLNAEAWSRVC